MVAYTSIAGSTKLGKGVVMVAKSGVINHLDIGALVLQNQPAQSRLAGNPALDPKRWLRASAAFAELPALVRRVRKLEARLAELEGDED